MNKGKDTCKTLKEIRRRIAEANGIDYSPTECSFKGECLGTCPACEQEIRFLEDKLAEKKRKGTRAKVAAVAAGICAVAMPQAVEAQTKTPMLGKVRITQNKAESINIYDLTTSKIGSVVVRGTVRDAETNEPLIGATIILQGTQMGMATDLDGMFAVRVAPDAVLQFSFVGFQNKLVKVGELSNLQNVNISLTPSNDLLQGEIIITGFSRPDDMYRRKSSSKPRSHKAKRR